MINLNKLELGNGHINIEYLNNIHKNTLLDIIKQTSSSLEDFFMLTKEHQVNPNKAELTKIYEFQRIAQSYYNGNLQYKEFIERCTKNIEFEIKQSIFGQELENLNYERFMIISNHPYLSCELFIPTNKIYSEIKGKNDACVSNPYEFIHDKTIFLTFFNKLIGDKIPFIHFTKYIGYANSLKEQGCTRKTRDILEEKGKSIFIIPEGKYSEGRAWNNGFLKIAKKLNISRIIVCRFSKRISLVKEENTNKAEIIDIINIKKETTIEDTGNIIRDLLRK